MQLMLAMGNAMNATYYVYILGSHSRTLYTGRTTDLSRRLVQHRSGTFDGFTKKYHVHKLLHVETFASRRDAARREQEIKRWRRSKKLALIEAHNPDWDDLAPTLQPDGSLSGDGRRIDRK